LESVKQVRKGVGKSVNSTGTTELREGFGVGRHAAGSDLARLCCSRLVLHLSPQFEFVFLICFSVLGFELRASALARQVFYHSSHAPSPLCSACFGNRVSLCATILLLSASLVAWDDSGYH
jgi:hypothetical protein